MGSRRRSKLFYFKTMKHYKAENSRDDFFTILTEYDNFLEYNIFEKGVIQANVLNMDRQVLSEFQNNKRVDAIGKFEEIKEGEFNRLKGLIL